MGARVNLEMNWNGAFSRQIPARLLDRRNRAAKPVIATPRGAAVAAQPTNGARIFELNSVRTIRSSHLQREGLIDQSALALHVLLRLR